MRDLSCALSVSAVVVVAAPSVAARGGTRARESCKGTHKERLSLKNLGFLEFWCLLIITD